MVNSGYARALRLVLVHQLARPDTYEDATIARALIRLLGKIATGERDGQALLHVIDSMGLDTNTRVQACWALANAAPRLPPHIISRGAAYLPLSPVRPPSSHRAKGHNCLVRSRQPDRTAQRTP